MTGTVLTVGTTARISPLMLDWFRTFLIIGSTVGAIFLAYARLDSRAAVALDQAREAKEKATAVEKEVRDTKEGFLQAVAGLASDVRNVKTILDERLPRPNPSVVPAAGSR